MNLTLSTLDRAIRNRLSADLADGVQRALAASRGADASPDSITTEEAGEAVLAALLGEPAIVLIEGATLETSAGAVELDLTTTTMHPLIGGWAPASLGGAIGQVLLGGAALTSIGHDGPTFGDIEVWRMADGAPVGCAILTFSGKAEVTVTLRYGVDPMPAGHRTIHVLGGDALYAAGEAASLGPRFSHSLAQDAGMAASMVAEALNSPPGVIH